MDGGYERDGFASLVVERLSGDEIEDVPVRRSWTGSMTIGALGGVNDAKRSTSDTDARTTTCPPARPPNVYVGSVERGERDVGINYNTSSRLSVVRTSRPGACLTCAQSQSRRPRQEHPASGSRQDAHVRDVGRSDPLATPETVRPDRPAEHAHVRFVRALPSTSWGSEQLQTATTVSALGSTPYFTARHAPRP